MKKTFGIVDGRNKDNIAQAVALIKAGDVVGFPTETVYGLGADAFNEKAVRKIFEIKKRPFNDPLILHIAGDDQLREIAEDLPPQGFRLIQKFWPGPLTIILKKTSKVSDLITAGLDTVAVRMPRNIIALALIKNSGTIIAAPSANRFQSLSPTTALAVEQELGKDVPLILDGGQSLVGLESTIINLVGKPEILRLGGVSVEDIEEVLDEKVSVRGQSLPSHILGSSKISISRGGVESEAMQAPGLSAFHYAPKKPTKFLTEKEFLANTGKSNLESAAIVCFSDETKSRLEKKGVRNIFSLTAHGDFADAAKTYFSLMRKIDQSDVKSIICIAVPDEDLGRAINERFRKAVHK